MLILGRSVIRCNATYAVKALVFLATTAMIIPIAIAVVMELGKERMQIELSRSAASSGIDLKSLDKSSMSVSPSGDLPMHADVHPLSRVISTAEGIHKSQALEEMRFEDFSPRLQEISKALIMSVAYAASIGGMWSLEHWKMRKTTNLVQSRPRETKVGSRKMGRPNQGTCLINITVVSPLICSQARGSVQGYTLEIRICWYTWLPGLDV